MSGFNLQLSEFAVLQVLAAGILMFLVIRLTRKILGVWLKARKSQAVIQRTLPAAEALIWLLFSIWSVGKIIQDTFYSSLIIMAISGIVILWVGWFAARDWIAGIILRMQDRYQPGQLLQVEDIRGKIRRIGYLAMEIERDNGEVLKIPYSSISGKVHGVKEGRDGANHHRFEINLTKDKPLPAVLSQLRLAVLNSVWSPLNKEPEIKLLKETSDAFVLEMIVFAPQDEFGRAIEEDVKREVGC